MISQSFLNEPYFILYSHENALSLYFILFNMTAPFQYVKIPHAIHKESCDTLKWGQPKGELDRYVDLKSRDIHKGTFTNQRFFLK